MILKQKLGFNDITARMATDGEGFRAPIPVDWRQGRTAYGGLTAGLALVAAQKTFPDLPPLRSANINFIGPVIGDPVFTAVLMRRGRNVTTVKVTGTIDTEIAGKGVVADIVFTFGTRRDSLLAVDVTAPPAPLPDDCKRFTPVLAQPVVPSFFLRFETKLIDGARPLSGAESGYIRTWSRHKNKASRSGMASLLTLSDVLPPAAMPMFKKMGPVSSVNFMLNFITDTPTTTDGWWQVETTLTAASGGYSSQIMRIFNYDGDLVAEGMQLVAIFI